MTHAKGLSPIDLWQGEVPCSVYMKGLVGGTVLYRFGF